MTLDDPAQQVSVIERGRRDDSCGCGLVCSRQTLDQLFDAGPVSAAQT